MKEKVADVISILSRRRRGSRRAAEAESKNNQIKRKIKRAEGTTKSDGVRQRSLTRDAKETGRKTETRTRAEIGRKTRPERKSWRRRKNATGRRIEIERKKRTRKGNPIKTENAINGGRGEKRKNDMETRKKSRRPELM